MESAPFSPEVDRFLAPTFLLNRKLMKLVGSDFYIYDDREQLALFVHQKGFKLKEDIRGYSNEQKTHEILRISARQVMDFAGVYDVFDSNTGGRIGVLKRMGWKSMLRDEWHVFDGNEVQIGVLQEDSMLMAVLRRFLSNLIPQNYDLMVGTERHIDLKQNFNPFTYHLNIVVEKRGIVDPRLGIAAAILLAAIEGRQSG